MEFCGRLGTGKEDLVAGKRDWDSGEKVDTRVGSLDLTDDACDMEIKGPGLGVGSGSVLVSNGMPGSYQESWIVSEKRIKKFGVKKIDLNSKDYQLKKLNWVKPQKKKVPFLNLGRKWLGQRTSGAFGGGPAWRAERKKFHDKKLPVMEKCANSGPVTNPKMAII
jgi:hypothetical protein